jgi:hypothetical protein
MIGSVIMRDGLSSRNLTHGNFWTRECNPLGVGSGLNLSDNLT